MPHHSTRRSSNITHRSSKHGTRENLGPCHTLAALTCPEEVTYHLGARLATGEIYTRLGSRCMVVVNPGRNPQRRKSVASSVGTGSSRNVSKLYADRTKTLGRGEKDDGINLSPHVFDIVSAAYLEMMRRKEDQAIISSGISNSGKTHTTKLITRHLCDLTKKTKLKTQIQSAILRADQVLTLFGNASTPYNGDASGFGRYTEYQFDGEGCLVGAKYIDYLLDKGRVSGARDGEDNFHVFYYLLAAATEEERQRWHLTEDPNNYRSLSSSNASTLPHCDVDYATVREHLSFLGVGRRLQAQIFAILAAILHLGNLGFRDSSSDDDECYVQDNESLVLIAGMLGLRPEALETALTTKLGIQITCSQAEQKRDALARTLYTALFTWLIHTFNEKLWKPDDGTWANYIAVLDLPGFVGGSQEEHGYHRLLLNFANELLNEFAIDRLYRDKAEELLIEGLETPAAEEMMEHGEVMELLGGLRTGILSVVDAETARCSDVDRIGQQIYEEYAHSPRFVPSERSRRLFGVVHHGGNICRYDVADFHQTNADTMLKDFVGLFKGSEEESGTSNPFIQSIFAELSGSTTEDVSISSKGNSLRRNKSDRNAPQEANISDPHLGATVGEQFRSAFNDLLQTLKTTKPWHIFHIAPSADPPSHPNHFEPHYVLHQLNFLNIPFLTTLPNVLYTTSISHTAFLQRYKSIWQHLHLPEPDRSTPLKTRALQLLTAMKCTTPSDAIIGRTKIFLTHHTWRTLETILTPFFSSQLEDDKSSFRSERKYSTDRFSVETKDWTSDKTLVHGGARMSRSSRGRSFEVEWRKSLGIIFESEAWQDVSTERESQPVPVIYSSTEISKLAKKGDMRNEDPLERDRATDENLGCFATLRSVFFCLGRKE